MIPCSSESFLIPEESDDENLDNESFRSKLDICISVTVPILIGRIGAEVGCPEPERN
jgi:hypothetical protein